MRWSLWTALGFTLFSHSAGAFSLETVASEGCHERLTLAAARRSLWPEGAVAPAVTHEDETLAANLPFQIPVGTDRWTIALMIGARDNDLEGHSVTDLPELAAVHGAADQSAHCLRSADQDFEGGNQTALDACRAFIRNEISRAIGDGPRPDLEATEQVMVSLRYQRQPLTLSRYAFHMGRALHALQDSYAHSFRRANPGARSSSGSLVGLQPTREPTGSTAEVMSVLNYIDPIFSIHFDEVRDGHPHMSAMDACRGSDFALERAQLAEDTSTQLLAAVARLNSEQESWARVEGVLDQSLHYMSGCDPGNGWCGAALEIAPASQHGCSTTSLLSPMWLGLLLLGRRRHQ